MTDKKIKVLIVNDQEEVCKLWERFLNAVDDIASVRYALDGQTALELVQEELPDVVLMDVMMPSMDGYETTRRIKAMYPECRIIIYSAYTGKGDEAYEAGAAQFLLMPITPEKLIRAIRHVTNEDA